MAPALLPVEKKASSESMQDVDASPATGGQLLNEAVAAYPDLAPVVKEHGTPDAVEVNLNRVALYYRNPPRTLAAYEEPSTRLNTVGALMDLNMVPRLVQRSGL